MKFARISLFLATLSSADAGHGLRHLSECDENSITAFKLIDPASDTVVVTDPFLSRVYMTSIRSHQTIKSNSPITQTGRLTSLRCRAVP
jgi:hypothetical protein